MPKTQTIITAYDPQNRNARGETVLTFDPNIVGRNPVALLMPWWDAQNAAVGGIPTVTGIEINDGVGTMTVADSNAASNYYLNALLVDPEIDDIHGLRAIANTTPKTSAGLLTVPGLPDGNDVNMLTPRWDNHHGMVGYAETVSSQKVGDPGPDSEVVTVSTNHASDYFVNSISAARNVVPHAAQSGTAHKVAGDVLRVYFPVPWNNPPVVFCTPYWKDANAQVGSIETINKVTTDYFEVASGNRAGNYYLNWLAVTSNPNFHKDHVDKGFAEFLAAHPDEAGQIAQHRAALESAILNGTPPPAALMHVKRKRSAPPAPVPEFSGAQIFKDAAAIAIDGLGLLVAGIGVTLSLAQSFQNTLVNTLAASMEAVADEVTPLINTLQRAQGTLGRIEGMAKSLLKFVAGLAGLGLLKTIVYQMLESLSWVDWVIASVKLVAQLLVLAASLVASAGFGAAAVVIAWIGRIAALIMASVSVGRDIRKLIDDLNAKGTGKASPA
ncbi:hypothetical protein [Pontixanthobacter aquaemixtae]|uniref:Uncharacterized protein n=1 Tax=Pontixanthobacter aquaemixtae TaxID=1958940 RepID=A0A844ZVK0_9SPHN|nr:hypothetical protein [Pontixanthobacter aquaemixtae]MXO91905.1 hypothetical protein [Pontixanthobacter aquaemixtae]